MPKANRKAFTLLEVLISIALMGIVMVALFGVVELLQDSNTHLLDNLKKTKTTTQTVKALYADMMSSDGNITLQKDEFSRVCMEQTRHSLYALPTAKVCWAVLKKDKTLVRIEGNDYHFPLLVDERVEVDLVMEHMKLFDIYHEKNQVLVLMQQENKEPISFMLQGITKPVAKSPVSNNPNRNTPNKNIPNNGTPNPSSPVLNTPSAPNTQTTPVPNPPANSASPTPLQ